MIFEETTSKEGPFMTDQDLRALLSRIPGADPGAMDRAARRQAELAKPPGSLGKLEDISIRLAGITGRVKNRIEKTRILVLAADNGVIAEGVSCSPESVTLAQCINMTRHKTGMSALAQYFGCDVVVADVGIHAPGPIPGLRTEKIRESTGNIRVEPAMTRQQCLDALEVGIRLAQEAKADGMDAIGVGEMGIGNTTTSSAVLAALTGASVEAVTGRGGGVTDRAFLTKKQVIEDALALHRPDPQDPVDVLSKVGGLDLAAMTGVYLGCALEGIPVVVDGFISIVAALCAVKLSENVRHALFLSHISYEIGYKIAQKELGLDAYLDLSMRLGEGSGCPLAFQLLKAACAVMNDMATFPEAAIDDSYLTEIRAKESFQVKKPC